MAKMDLLSLRALLQNERSGALSSRQASTLMRERTDAQNYYNGVMPDLVAPDGRSKAVSTDVSDTIEGLMPPLMDIFCGTDDVVRFDPVGPEDQEAADQETDYINHVFMQKNPGFLILYSFIKDALLSKNGIVKIFWEKEEKQQRETYYDLTDDQFMMLLNEPNVEIVEHTAKDMPGYGTSA